MVHLFAAFIAALAVAVSAYDATGSYVLAFIAYSISGTFTLIMAVLFDYYSSADQDTFDATAN